MIVYYQFEVVMADDVVEENEICFVQEISIDYRDGGEHYLGGSIIRGARREGYKEVYLIISYSKATSNT